MVIHQQASLRMEQRTGDPHRAIGCPQQGIRRELPPESVWFAALGKQACFIQCCLKRVAVDPDARCQLGWAVRDNDRAVLLGVAEILEFPAKLLQAAVKDVESRLFAAPAPPPPVRNIPDARSRNGSPRD